MPLASKAEPRSREVGAGCQLVSREETGARLPRGQSLSMPSPWGGGGARCWVSTLFRRPLCDDLRRRCSTNTKTCIYMHNLSYGNNEREGAGAEWRGDELAAAGFREVSGRVLPLGKARRSFRLQISGARPESRRPFAGGPITVPNSTHCPLMADASVSTCANARVDGAPSLASDAVPACSAPVKLRLIAEAVSTSHPAVSPPVVSAFCMAPFLRRRREPSR